MTSEDYVGSIDYFCGDFAPEQTAVCNGDLIPIAPHDALYAMIGTDYGKRHSQLILQPKKPPMKLTFSELTTFLSRAPVVRVLDAFYARPRILLDNLAS